MDILELNKRLRALHASDLGALIASFPEAAIYISKGTHAERATELIEWATKSGKLGDVEKSLARWTTPVDPTREQDPKTYLEWIHEYSAFIDIRGLAVGSGKAHRFPIEELYIPLTIAAQPTERVAKELGRGSPRQDQPGGELAPDLRGTGHCALQTALQARTLAIIGDPGAGKSTFLNRIAAALCDVWLGRDPDAARTRLGLPDRLLPLLIRVEELTEHIRRCQESNSGPTLGSASPDWLAHFLGAQAAANNWGLDAAFFQSRLSGGQVIVMLDGLDQAPSRVVREQVAELTRRAAMAYKGCRFVVTGRPAAFVDTCVLSDFAQVVIEPLGDAAIDGFLVRWCEALFHDAPSRSARHCGELRDALRSRPEIRRLARNPVMLTALAVLHWNEKRLPEQRAELYESIVTWLARAREKSKPERPAAERALALLQTLALAMQDAGGKRETQMPRRWAAERIAPSLRECPETERVEKADAFLAEEELDSGIVVARGNEIRFWHLTFQEYLAARALAACPERVQEERLLRHVAKLYSPEWRETVLLLAGVLLYKQGMPKADGMVSSILDGLGEKASLADQARCAGLLGAITRDLSVLKYEPDDPRYKPLFERVLAVFDPARSGSVPIRDAIAAAEALGQAGDPRLDAGSRAKNWVHIPAGEFLMGAQTADSRKPNYDKEADDDEAPVHAVRLSAFDIGRYPVSVREYAEFVDAEGYGDPGLWTAGGHGQWQTPEEWDAQREHPTRPVVGVSWFEACAYARWTGGNCRLPTEAEWERAARGTTGRKYPWGEAAPDGRLLNYDGSKVGCPTPVGVYPRGATPEGICDLAGNVWEWCLDGRRKYTKTPQTDPLGSMEKGAWRSLRGGCFWIYARYCRSAYRSASGPGDRIGLLGFRLAAGQPVEPAGG